MTSMIIVIRVSGQNGTQTEQWDEFRSVGSLSCIVSGEVTSLLRSQYRRDIGLYAVHRGIFE